MKRKLIVDLEPVGRRGEANEDTSLLDVAQSVGVEMASVCGGEGWCGKCRVRLISGILSPLTEDEKNAISRDDIQSGYRLACQSKPLSDVKIDIPPETLTTTQRLQLEGVGSDPYRDGFDPIVKSIDLQLNAPHLEDLESDLTRVCNGINSSGATTLHADLPVLRNLSHQLRSQAWSLRLAVFQDEIIGVFPSGSLLVGLAVDIGTTKMAAYLVNLENGETLAKGGLTNPQVVYGEDVVSRIAFANQSEENRKILQYKLVERLNELTAYLCGQAGVKQDQIVEVSVVGNTAIHHLFLGLPVRQLGEAPYIAAVSNSVHVRASDVGVFASPGAYIYMPPNIAGFVGADHVSMLLASGILAKQKAVVALDIGTNTEISLYVPTGAGSGRLLSCSCASGPAFEGAHIHDGMRAMPGAIEKVQIHEGAIRIHTIGDALPVGLCGSGILDAVAEMRRVGFLDSAGRIKKDIPGMRPTKNGGEFVLVPAGKTGHGRDVIVNRKDVNEIQLAKGAIRAGIEVLLTLTGISYEDIDEFIIAGAFGTYLDVENAVRIGMFPSISLNRFKQVGNAAGMGARLLLLSQKEREKAEQIARQVEYIELTTHLNFTNVYVDALNF
ncbi:MAG: ASKHA domain-containing protein [Chloroflexota bacterium]